MQIKIVYLNQSSSLIVHNFSHKKLKKLYPDLKFISYFVRNTSDVKLKMFLSYMRDTTVIQLIHPT